MTDPAGIPALQDAIRHLEGCGSEHFWTTPVEERTPDGKEIVWTEYNSTLGTEGDIVFADMSQYTLVDKNGVQAATSMHVAFLTDQMVFRITYRFDGKPMWTVPLAPFAAAGLYHSPFIALASR